MTDTTSIADDRSRTADLNFRSDNVATVSPQILQALVDANKGPAASYGDDEYSALLNDRFSALFEKHVTVFPVSTGTAANALALASCARPWGGIYCHEEAHIHTAEGGATEAFTGGAKLIALPGAQFRLSPTILRDMVAHAARGVRNRPQPDVVSITQASEYGTVYPLADIAAIGEIARREKIAFHMDGARFANALATLQCSPAEMTWRAGVDILSFGATKNGAMGAEAIVVFEQALAEPLSYRIRRAGQTWSKMRYAAAQLIAYVADDLFLRNAGHANDLASRLASGLSALPEVSLLAPVEANLVFAVLPDAAIDALVAAGARFAKRRAGVIRLVTRFDGCEADVDRFIDLAQMALTTNGAVRPR
jgi:threonine aldolase